MSSCANIRIYGSLGDLASRAEMAWVLLIAGSGTPLTEMILLKLRKLKAQVRGPNPSPLERLLVGASGSLWLQVYYSDMAAAEETGSDLPLDDFEIKRLELRSKAISQGNPGACDSSEAP